MQLKDTHVLLIGAVIVVAVYAVRHALAGLTSDHDVSTEHVALTAIMVPKGLAAAVLAGLPLQQGVVGGEMIQGIAFVVVLLSIGLTAVMIPIQRSTFGGGLYRKLFRSQQT
jgi:NhaP-type Na+/H+ or K+/H+ antiporter